MSLKDAVKLHVRTAKTCLHVLTSPYKQRHPLAQEVEEDKNDERH